MPISLPEDARAALTETLRDAVQAAWDEDLSDLRARLLLDAALSTVGPVVYNLAIRDAQAQLVRIADDLPGVLYEAEPAPRRRWRPVWTTRPSGLPPQPRPAGRRRGG